MPSHVKNVQAEENAMLEGEGQGEYIMTTENFDGYVLAADISEAEGVEP